MRRRARLDAQGVRAGLTNSPTGGRTNQWGGGAGTTPRRSNCRWSCSRVPAQLRGQAARHGEAPRSVLGGTACTWHGRGCAQPLPPAGPTLLSTGRLCAMRMSPPATDFFSQQARAAESQPKGLCQAAPAAPSRLPVPCSGRNTPGGGSPSPECAAPIAAAARPSRLPALPRLALVDSRSPQPPESG